MMKLMAYGLAAMVVFFSGPVLADGGVYQIELMVFSQAMPNTEVFEQSDSRIKWPTDLTELSAYKQAEKMTLDDSYAALAKDPAYKPLLHVAWVQTLADLGLSAPVHIQGADGKLNGYLQMQHEQGLQMTVDLEFSANSAGDVGKPALYRLYEKRGVKLHELYYLDHPKFGLVVKISPLS